MKEKLNETLHLYQTIFWFFSGPFYNFKLFSGSAQVWVCSFGFGPDLVGPLTTLCTTATTSGEKRSKLLLSPNRFKI